MEILLRQANQKNPSGTKKMTKIWASTKTHPFKNGTKKIQFCLERYNFVPPRPEPLHRAM
jgi:hypothetical protein